MNFDYSGMKEMSEFGGKYKMLAVSTNGANKVCSYIAKKKGRRIYGCYDYQKAKYNEEITN